jgi:hypothetical protein
MIAGLPGTGIGGLFYLLLAVFMPVCEFFRLIQKRSHLGRWCFIALQLGFVSGIISLMWLEVWGLNYIAMQFCHIFKINHTAAASILGARLTFHQARIMAYASASGSFISLGFVFICVHILRLLVSRSRKISLSPGPSIYKPNKMPYSKQELIRAQLLQTRVGNAA